MFEFCHLSRGLVELTWLFTFLRYISFLGDVFFPLTICTVNAVNCFFCRSLSTRARPFFGCNVMDCCRLSIKCVEFAQGSACLRQGLINRSLLCSCCIVSFLKCHVDTRSVLLVVVVEAIHPEWRHWQSADNSNI